MKTCTYVPKPGQEEKPRYLQEQEEVFYDVTSLEEVNNIRMRCGKSPITSLNGYCMSSGCSCYDPKPLPICGLFRSYDADGIKKDFINQIFGI